MTPGLPQWANEPGPDSDVALVTRARLARNLALYPFPWRASEEQRRRVAQEIRQAAKKGDLAALTPVALWQRPAEERALLVESQRISPEMADGQPERWALLDLAGTLSVLVNEEDHLRLQAMEAGNAPAAALARAECFIGLLSDGLELAYEERYGYLTTSLNNVGTGLRLSVLLHLPALAYLGTLREKLAAAYQMDGAIRGLHGEGSASAGDLYQVSHAVSYGHTTTHFRQLVEGAARYLIAEERLARVEVAATLPRSLNAQMVRVETTIQQAESLDWRQALDLLSALRLAAVARLRPGTVLEPFARLPLQLRTVGHDTSPRAGIARAALLRTLLRSGQ